AGARGPRPPREVSLARHPGGVRGPQLLARLPPGADALADGEAPTPPGLRLPLVPELAARRRPLDLRPLPAALRHVRGAGHLPGLRGAVRHHGVLRLWQAASDGRVGHHGPRLTPSTARDSTWA